MSVIWRFVNPVKARPYVKDRRFFAHVAPHIRGRVFLLGPSSVPGKVRWGMEVINTHTGEVLASDNCTLHEALVDCCDETTAAARAAWFWEFRRKAVRA